MRKLTVHNLDLLRWGNKTYIVPLNELKPTDLTTIQARGQSTVQKVGFFKRLKRALFENSIDSGQRTLNEDLAISAGLSLVYEVEDEEAFINFKEAVFANYRVFVPLVTDPDIMSRQITDEAYTQKDIALSFVVKYVGEAAIPSTREEVALGDAIEELAENVVNDILTQDEYRRKLQVRIRDTRRALNSIRSARTEDLPKDLDIEELLRISEQAFEAYEYEYNALIETTRDKMMDLKKACENLTQMHDSYNERTYLRSEVRLLEELTRHRE